MSDHILFDCRTKEGTPVLAVSGLTGEPPVEVWREALTGGVGIVAVLPEGLAWLEENTDYQDHTLTALKHALMNISRGLGFEVAATGGSLEFGFTASTPSCTVGVGLPNETELEFGDCFYVKVDRDGDDEVIHVFAPEDWGAALGDILNVLTFNRPGYWTEKT